LTSVWLSRDKTYKELLAACQGQVLNLLDSQR
jgi:hypothetical protein